MIGLGASGSLLDRGERMMVASVWEEGERYGSSGIKRVIGWKGG